MPMTVYGLSPWGKRALRYADEARNQIEFGIDAIASLDAAKQCLRIEAGEAPEDPELMQNEDEGAGQ